MDMNLFCKKTFLLVVLLMLVGMEYAQAQTLRYTTETHMKMHGMGNLASRMMGGNKPTTTTHFITSDAMRSDDGKNESTIFNLEGGKIITLDHKKKRYHEMTFEQMTSMLDNARMEVGQKMEEAEAEGFNPDDVHFELSVDDLGESKDVAGYRADRKLMKMTFAYDGEMQDAYGQTQSMRGKMYTVSDMWIAQGVEGEEIMKQFGKNFAEKFGAEFSDDQFGMAGVMQSVMGGAMSDAMSSMREEMKKIDGTMLESTVYVVMVPEGKELDVDAVLSSAEQEKPKKKRGGLGRLARGALQSSGISVGDNPDEQEAQAAMEEQRIVVETKTIYKEIGMVSDDESRYTAPNKYKQVDPPQYFNQN